MTEAEATKELSGEFSPIETGENSNERMSEQLIIKVPSDGTVRGVYCTPGGDYLLGWVVLDTPHDAFLRHYQPQVKVALLRRRLTGEGYEVETLASIGEPSTMDDYGIPYSKDFYTGIYLGSGSGFFTRHFRSLSLTKDESILDLQAGDELFWRTTWYSAERLARPGGAVQVILEYPSPGEGTVVWNETEGYWELVGEFGQAYFGGHNPDYQRVIKAPYDGTVRDVSCTPEGIITLGDVNLMKTDAYTAYYDLALIKRRSALGGAASASDEVVAFIDPDRFTWYVDRFRGIGRSSLSPKQENVLELAKDESILNLQEGDELLWRTTWNKPPSESPFSSWFHGGGTTSPGRVKVTLVPTPRGGSSE